MLNSGDGLLNETDQRLGGTPTFSVALGDLDGDGDLDMLVAVENSFISVWQNDTPISTPRVGDANHDDRFDQLDIVQVLQAGKYLADQAAAFSEGDWNCDGQFDQLDIVAALQSGDYLEGR